MKSASTPMKPVALALIALAAACLPVRADEAAPPATDKEAQLAKHKSGAAQLAGDQDELSADVQELIEEQTAENVIELLEAVEEIMAEVTGNLDESNTGGQTLAAETEIIEKIFEAAKKRQQQDGSSPQSQESMGAMLEMMQRMMGQQPGDQPGQKPGDQNNGSQAENGGDSDAANDAVGGDADGSKEQRRVPKSSGTAGTNLPDEFQKALDAYNASAKDTPAK